jgi:hypothetical protein
MGYHFPRTQLWLYRASGDTSAPGRKRMIAIPLAVLLLFGAPQEAAPQKSDPASQQQLEEAKARYESIRQAAININELAGKIHSEADARNFVDAIAERLSGNQHQSWTTLVIRHRVAHAEYEAVSDSSRLIPEQRIVDVWNEYVREIDAPEETLVTVAELHNLRDAMYTMSKLMWEKHRFWESLWTMPGLYAVDADGRVANGCRAIEALKLLHDMVYNFQNVRSARERVQKGVLVSDSIRLRQRDPTPRPPAVRAQTGVVQNGMPVWIAERSYLQAHSERDYRRLLERLFAELFPTE